MPSAASVKIDKTISAENALAESAANSTPLRQAITIIEHKIRNLEKRKAKLESYRELQNSGKDLNHDQKTAVAKFDEVVQTLEFARDLCKQFLTLVASSEKEAKKQARKEAAAKSQAELAKLREVLLVQDALTQMGNETTREDFLNGRNGASQLTASDLKLLDDLYPAVTPKHEAGEPHAFMEQVQAAAEHLLGVVDGKPKEAFGGTYSQIKEVIGKIHESGYLDQAQESIVYEEVTETEATPAQPTLAPPQEPLMNLEVLPAQAQKPMPALETLTIEPMAPMAPIVDVPPTIKPQLPPETIYFQQPLPQPQPLQPPQVQPPRPISEVIGGGSFFFLQESELDTPPEQIPSQTFTNQNYVAGPPPPIPLPPHFQQYSGGPNQAPLPGNGMVMEDNINVNQNEDSLKQQRNDRPPRPNNQPFYANNNGYNKPRQNRNGPRPSNRPNQ